MLYIYLYIYKERERDLNNINILNKELLQVNIILLHMWEKNRRVEALQNRLPGWCAKMHI